MRRWAVIALSATSLLACGPRATELPAEIPRATEPDPGSLPPLRSRWVIEAIDGAGVHGRMQLWPEGNGRVVMLYQRELTSAVARRTETGWSTTELAHQPATGARGPDGRIWLVSGFAIEPRVLRIGVLSGDGSDGPATIRQHGFAQARMHLVIDARGVRHVCFHDYEVDEEDGSGFIGALRYATDRGDGWLSVVVTEDRFEQCSLAVDSDGGVHLVTFAGGSGVHYFQGDAAGLHEVRVIEGDYGGALIAVDSEDRVHLAFRAQLGGGGHTSTLGHLLLSSEQAVVHAATSLTLAGVHRGGSHAFVFDASGRLHAAFRSSERQLGYATFAEDEWRHEVVGPSNGLSREPSLAIAMDDGRPIIAFSEGSEFVMMARLLPPSRCSPGRELIGARCCWPGQELQGGECAGTAECPEGFHSTETGCEATPVTIRWDVSACRRNSLHEYREGPRRGCDRLREGGMPHVDAFAARCRSGDGASCFAADALLRGRAHCRVTLFARPCESGFCEGYHAVCDRHPAVSEADTAWGRRLLDAGCRAGHADSCEVLAIEVDEGASARAERSCRAGSADACARLAAVNQREPNGPLVALARRQITAACEGTDPGACANLGVLRLLGWGGATDARSAADAWLRLCTLTRAGGRDRRARYSSCVQLVYLRAGQADAISRAEFRSADVASLLQSACNGNYAEACHACALAAGLGVGFRLSRREIEYFRARACRLHERDRQAPIPGLGCAADEAR